MILMFMINFVVDVRHRDWLWIVVDFAFFALGAIGLYKDWAWYPQEKKNDEDKDDLNKTKELRDTWKEKL